MQQTSNQVTTVFESLNNCFPLGKIAKKKLSVRIFLRIFDAQQLRALHEQLACMFFPTVIYNVHSAYSDPLASAHTSCKTALFTVILLVAVLIAVVTEVFMFARVIVC